MKYGRRQLKCSCYVVQRTDATARGVSLQSVSGQLGRFQKEECGVASPDKGFLMVPTHRA